jgi:hypothetical protein
VVGSASKRRYTITNAASYNVVDEAGTQLCFGPRQRAPYGLPRGDILLAQKLALELDEEAALKVANRANGRPLGWREPALRLDNRGASQTVAVTAADDAYFEYCRQAVANNRPVWYQGRQWLVQGLRWSSEPLVGNSYFGGAPIAVRGLVRYEIDLIELVRLEHGARQSGQTTDQMQAAPPHAIFIWCNDLTDYPRALARRLGRTDLQIEPLSGLDDGHRLRGVRAPALILDHAARLSGRQRCVFEHLGQACVQIGGR